MRFSDHRRQYTLGGLRRADLAEEPVAQFVAWQEQAIAAGLADPTACVLATQQPDQKLRQRMVLMKGVDAHGLVFYTNYQSHKGSELANVPHAALVFWWPTLQRQVRIEGRVEKASAEVSDAYFANRPRDSQLGAWISQQSVEIPDRDWLEERKHRFEQVYDGQPVKRPNHWGGYRIEPSVVEFWQGQEDRLHDRLRYSRHEGHGWMKVRLAP